MLTGAVQIGCHPELISVRVSRLSYGVLVNRRDEPGCPGFFIHREENLGYTSRAFSTFVKRGEEVDYDSEITHSFRPTYKNLSNLRFMLYATDSTTSK
jgi:hypothetical protein